LLNKSKEYYPSDTENTRSFKKDL